jgi:hypothetical protein
MKKTNYKLPGLPSVQSVPKATPTTTSTPVRDAAVSKVGGLNNGASQPLNFGKASRAATRNPAATSTWSKVLSSTTSGGLANTLSGVTGFSGGISSLISGLTNLFGGGKTTPPALVAYQLPTSQQQTISIGSSVSTAGVYGGPTPSKTPFQSESSQIVQTVKQALLNSSSLNDVITEL